MDYCEPYYCEPYYTGLFVIIDERSGGGHDWSAEKIHEGYIQTKRIWVDHISEPLEIKAIFMSEDEFNSIDIDATVKLLGHESYTVVRRADVKLLDE